jgi:hypothetical protein
MNDYLFERLSSVRKEENLMEDWKKISALSKSICQEEYHVLKKKYILKCWYLMKG